MRAGLPPPPLPALDTPNFDKASPEEEAIRDTSAPDGASREEADGAPDVAAMKKARVASVTPAGRVRGVASAGGGGGNKKKRKPTTSAGYEAGESDERGKKAKVAADGARAERLRKRVRATGGDEARAGEGDGDQVDVGEEEEPRAKATRRRGHAAAFTTANQAGQIPGD